MLRVIELFSGIGAQVEALKELGIKHEVIATSDIDKHANKGYEAIHGKVNNLGDVTKIEHLPECDLLTYSYPCTSVSVAGKREGMLEGSGTASALLWEVGRLLEDMRERDVLPEVLLMENVDAVLNSLNRAEFNRWIATLDAMGYCSSYKILNAKDYGTPQNRKRCFMVSTRSLGKFEFPKPCPDGRVLRDVLEHDVPESYYLSEKRLRTFIAHAERNSKKGNGFGFKVHPLTDEKAERERGDFAQAVMGQADRYCQTWVGIPKSECHREGGYIMWPNKTKKGYLEARPGDGLVMGYMGQHRGAVQKDMAPTISTRLGGDAGTVIPWVNGLKSGYSMAAVGDGLKIYPKPSLPGAGGTVQQKSANALNTYEGCGSGTIDEQTLRVRYLTPRECLRLQAFPDDAIDRLMAVLPKSALYKVAGNSIAVCCLKAIFKGIYIDRTFSKMYRQTNMLDWGA